MTADDCITRLRRRADHLTTRINASTHKDLTWDKAELSALHFAITHLTLCKGDFEPREGDDLSNCRDAETPQKGDSC
jgi:hypothetical protein